MKKDHLEILLEDIRSKFELVLEGHESLNRKMDEGFSTLNDKIAHNSFMIGALNDKIDQVDSRLSKQIYEVEKNLTKKIDAVASDLSAHRADTETHHGIWKVKES